MDSPSPKDPVETQPVHSWIRDSLAALACVVVGAAFVAAWWWLKRHSLHIWTDLNFFFIPILIGTATGWCVRLISRTRGFGIVSFAILVTIGAGVMGGALQQKVAVDYSLRIIAKWILKQNFDYAIATVLAETDEQLRTAMIGQPLTVIGRLAAETAAEPQLSYWDKRHLLHINFFLSRRLPSYQVGGTEAILWEPTCLVDRTRFLDELVDKGRHDDPTDADLDRFRKMEREYLDRLLRKEISGHQFEAHVFGLLQNRITWHSLALRGCFPFVGFAILLGCTIAYAVAHQKHETEQL
jgi:hypothetical protein